MNSEFLFIDILDCLTETVHLRLQLPFFLGTCYGDIQTGHWGGNKVVPEFTTSNYLECGIRCCSENACKLWVWRTRDKMCYLKSDNDLRWYPDGGSHFAARKVEGATFTFFKLFTLP